MGEGTPTLDRWEEHYFFLSELASKWRDIHLPTILDTAAYDRVLSQHGKIRSRREEVRNVTKSFSQLSNEEKLNEFAGIFKEYQTYIDQLTSYLKDTERSYVELYNQVSGMTDPYPFMEKLSLEMETMLEEIEKIESYDALEKEVQLLQTELQGLKDQEVTIERLRRQLAESERKSMQHAEQSAQDATAEYQTLLSHSNQWKQELQKEIHSLKHEIAKKDTAIQDLRNHVVELRATVEEVETRRGREIAEIAMELEISQTNLLKKETELERLLASHNSDVYSKRTEHTPVAALKTTSSPEDVVDYGDVAVSSSVNEEDHNNNNNNNNNSDVVPFQKATECDDTKRWEEERMEMKHQEDTLRKELFELRVKYDDLRTLSENQLRQKKEEYERELVRTQELQQRMTSLNMYVEQLKAEKEQLARAVQSLERELSKTTTTTGATAAANNSSRNNSTIERYSLVQANTNNAQTEVPHVRRDRKYDLDPIEKDGYRFEKLLSSSSVMWQSEENSLGKEGNPGKQKEELPSSHASLPLSSPPHEAEKDPFLIVASQRDKLRERLLTLNEIMSSQIHGLKLQVANLSSENFSLRQRIASYSDREAYSGNDGLSIYGLPSLVGMEKDDGLHAKAGFPRFVDPVEGVYSRRTVLNVIDYGAGMLSMRVFSTVLGRRLFVMYMVLLHAYLVYIFFR